MWHVGTFLCIKKCSYVITSQLQSTAFFRECLLLLTFIIIFVTSRTHDLRIIYYIEPIEPEKISQFLKIVFSYCAFDYNYHSCREKALFLLPPRTIENWNVKNTYGDRNTSYKHLNIVDACKWCRSAKQQAFIENKQKHSSFKRQKACNAKVLLP